MTAINWPGALTIVGCVWALVAIVALGVVNDRARRRKPDDDRVSRKWIDQVFTDYESAMVRLEQRINDLERHIPLDWRPRPTDATQEVPKQ